MRYKIGMGASFSGLISLFLDQKKYTCLAISGWGPRTK